MRWFFPDNYMWDVGAAIAVNAGGTVGEVSTLAARLRGAAERNALGEWVREFSTLSEQTEAIGRRELESGYHVGAGESLTRASVYAQVALRFEPRGSQRDKLLGRSLDLFEAGLRYRSECIEVVRIPYQGTALRGYLARPPRGRAPFPVVVVLGDFDTTAENLVQCALPMATRGLAVLVVDGPGYGEALQRQCLVSRHDYEVVGTAVAGFVDEAPELDGERLGVMGIGLGGYYAMRVVAFEARYRAVAAWGAAWDAGSRFRGRATHYTDNAAGDPVSTPAFQLQYTSGTDSTSDALAFWHNFHLRDVAEQVTVAALVVHGENDQQVPVADAYRLYAALGSGHKDLCVVPRGTPGEEHCQWDGIRAAQQPLGDFFAAHLVAPLIAR